MFGKGGYSSRRFKPVKMLFFATVFIGLFAVFSWIVMLLWNAILPDVAGIKPLNFWEAAGLLILSKILFGRMGGRGPWRHTKRKHWRKRWMGMSPEERQEAKSRWKDYCHRRDSSTRDKI